MIDETYRPTVAQLRAFVAVAEYRHFGTAAQRLGVSQPTLSQALASLEHGLGVSLIERSTRKVLVTDAGRELLGRALAALEAVDGFVTAAAGIESWDRMYYFRVPVLMSELNRMMRTPGVTWRNLPGADAEGLIVFVSQEQVVRAVADREPPLYLSGFGTSDSSVTPDALAGIPRLAVESRGR